MLENIITNPIETPRGYKNPVHGIALRGPLSQFFSGIYLKPLDDAFRSGDSTYIRYQDDILILCQTKRQMNRCRRRMMEVLHERRLTLSRKKSRIGSLNKNFHFLGIHYPGTQTLDNTNVSHSNDDSISEPIHVAQHLTAHGGGKTTIEHQVSELMRIEPHPRTLRKAREQIKSMVIDGISFRRIRNYLHLWTTWWVRTAGWQYQKLLCWFIDACWDINIVARAMTLMSHINQLTFCKSDLALETGQATLSA